MSWPLYPSYKESGKEWLGQLPAHWHIVPLRAMLRRKVVRNHPELPLLSVYRDYGVVLTDSRDDNYNRPSLDLSSYLVVDPDDLVLNKMKTWQGSLAVSRFRGIVSPAYIVCEVSPTVDTGYLHYLLRSSGYVCEYGRNSYGVRVNQWDMRFDDFKQILALVPPRSEQRAIAAFLDHETAKIDALIAKQQRLIELLQEKRTALISHAATRGLDPNVPMKDSGVEWLGEIPAHWEVRRLKHAVQTMVAGPFGSSLTKDMYTTSGYRVYGQEQVIPADFTIGDYYVSSTKYQEMRRYSVAPGDVLVSCVGTFGKVAVVPPEAEPGIINPRLVKLVPAQHVVSPRYLGLLLRSEEAFQQMQELSRGGTMGVINLGLLSQLELVLPPPEEQHVIVEYVEHEVGGLDELLAKVQEAIERLQEYRTALVSAAVTGNIDVRQEAQL